MAEQEERERLEHEAHLAEVQELEARLNLKKVEVIKREAELEWKRKAKEAQEAEEALKRGSERLDGELAQRLAHENQDVVLDGTPKTDVSVHSKYTHSELREIMNTTSGMFF